MWQLTIKQHEEESFLTNKIHFFSEDLSKLLMIIDRLGELKTDDLTSYQVFLVRKGEDDGADRKQNGCGQ